MKLSDVKGTTSVDEGYTILPPIDTDKYGERQGLEGPFRTRSGKVVYYDPKEGMYYDPDTDIYISYDEWKKLDEVSDYARRRKADDDMYSGKRKPKKAASTKSIAKTDYMKKRKKEVDETKSIGRDDLKKMAEEELRKLAQEYEGTLAGMGHRDENEIIADMERIAKPYGLEFEDYIGGDMYESNAKAFFKVMEDIGAGWDRKDNTWAVNGEIAGARIVNRGKTTYKISESYVSKLDEADRPVTYLLKVSRNRASEGGPAIKYFKFNYAPSGNGNPFNLRAEIDKSPILQRLRSEESFDGPVKVVAAWTGNIDDALATAQQKLTGRLIPSVKSAIEQKVAELTKAKNIMSKGNVTERKK